MHLRKKKRKEPRNEWIDEINGKVYSQLGLKKDVLSTTIDLKVGNTKQAIIESILGLWQKRLDTFCENRKKACKDLRQIGTAKNHYHHHHHVFTLDRGTSPWIDPTGVCSAWLVSTIRVRSLWWDRLSILFLDDHVFWSKLRTAFSKRLRADITFMHNGLPQFKWYKLGRCRLTLSVTSSTPIINPLPLTSPTTSGNSLLRSRSFSIKYVPTTSEFFCVPSSSMACQQK